MEQMAIRWLLLPARHQIREFTTQIIEAKDDNELNKALFSTIEKMGLSLPWEGDFDEFMSDEDTTLVFE